MWLRLLVAIMAPRLVIFIPEKISLAPNSSLSSMSLTNKHPGGRPPARIISTHFERLEKLPNKSGRYYWKCIYCTDSEGSGLHLEGRDGVLLQHLSNPQSCPNASPKYVTKHAEHWLQKEQLMQTMHLYHSFRPSPPHQEIQMMLMSSLQNNLRWLKH